MCCIFALFVLVLYLVPNVHISLYYPYLNALSCFFNVYLPSLEEHAALFDTFVNNFALKFFEHVYIYCKKSLKTPKG